MKRPMRGEIVVNEEADLWLLNFDDDIKAIQNTIDKKGCIETFGIENFFKKEYLLDIIDKRD